MRVLGSTEDRRPAPLGRLHLFMVLAMAVAGIAGTGLVLYWLVLLFLFFPWSALPLRDPLRRWWRGGLTGSSSDSGG